MKSDQTIIRKNLMKQLNFITNLLGIKDPNITILDVLDAGTHKEIIAKLDFPAPKMSSLPRTNGYVISQKRITKISTIINQKITQKLIEKVPIPMTAISESLAVSTSTVIRKLKEFEFRADLNWLPVLLYSRQVRSRVKIINIDMFSPYYDLARPLFPNAKIVLDRFHIVQHLSRAMSRVRVQIMNQLDRKSHEYRAIKRYWKLIQQDSRKLSHKRCYRPTFRMHLTNKEILEKLLSYSQELREHYEIYRLLLFHFQETQSEHFFGLIEETISCINPIFQTVFKTFLKDKDKIINAIELPYSNAKLEATNNLIKVIKRNAFGFRNFDNFKTRILIALNIKKERTFWELTTVDKEPNKYQKSDF